MMNTKVESSEKTTADVRQSIMPDRTAHLIFWPIVILGVIADLWSKNAVFEWLKALPNGRHVFIDGYFKFIMAHNYGAAWSIASGKTTLLVTVSVVAFVVILAIFLFGSIRQRLMQVGLALFTAGILGNLYDRAFNGGAVRDFIDVTIPVINYRWPAFNIADSMLCVAVGLLMISSFTAPKPDEAIAKP